MEEHRGGRGESDRRAQGDLWSSSLRVLHVCRRAARIERHPQPILQVHDLLGALREAREELLAAAAQVVGRQGAGARTCVRSSDRARSAGVRQRR
jgi:hypothetical protein